MSQKTNTSLEYIPAEQAQSLSGLFRSRVQMTPDNTAYRYFCTENKEWRDLSWSTIAQNVSRWQQSIQSCNLQVGDKVAILVPNCPQWVEIEQAALGLGLVVVPLYVDDRPDNTAYILQNAEVKLLFVHQSQKWQQIYQSNTQSVNNLSTIVVLENKPRTQAQPKSDDTRIVYSSDWLKTTTKEILQYDAKNTDLATIVYTSGTTGKPKGVMLSHYNILSNAQATLLAFESPKDKLYLSFLPLSHMFERTVGYYIPMMSGATVAYARSIQDLGQDMLDLKPHFIVSVPRIFERIYDIIHRNQCSQSFLTRLLFDTTVNIGWRRFLIKQGRAKWSLNQIFWPLLDKIVATKLRDCFGGELIIAACGGAALSESVAKIFLSMDVNIIQGYGMTETSPVITTNKVAQNEPASVGIALPEVETKIDATGQLLVRGPGNMLGYWKNESATNEVIDKQGWIKTGDIVKIENDYIYITGRSKDIIVLSNGEKVPPTDMEAAITLHPLFEQVLVIGEGRSYLSALLVVNPTQLSELLKHYNIKQDSKRALESKPLQQDLLARISQQLHDFPGYAEIRCITIILEPWSIANGLMTPTLKIKRELVTKHYAAQIEMMYQK